jgi:outer membrane protein OmpA-like peptidoglycan-associated protein
MVAGAEAGIAEVRAVAESAGRQADSADDRTLTLARMFADRSRYVVEDSREIYFTFASSAIAPEHSEALQAVSDMLDSNPDAILVLEGRTDATGDPAFNEQLGQKRADATRNYLVMEMGVPIYKVHSFSFGEARPDYDNGVVEERQKNRSVKLLILGPDPQTAVASLPE